jgi:uncharacterized tellurite resistance protein B-like protein
MEHPARSLPEPQKIEYLLAVAQFVWADGVVAKPEMRRLSDVCDALALAPSGREKLIAAAAAPDPKRVDAAVHWIKEDVALRFSLMGDAILIAFADGILADPEAAEIVQLAQRLGVETEQAMAMARYVEGLLRVPSNKTDPSIRLLSRQLEAALAKTDADAGAQAAAPERRSWFRQLLGLWRSEPE